MLLPYLIYNLSDRGDEFSAAEHGNASAYEMRSVQARSRMRISHASLARRLRVLAFAHDAWAPKQVLLGTGAEFTKGRL